MGASPHTQRRLDRERARRGVQEPADVEPPALTDAQCQLIRAQRDKYWSLLNQVWAILSDLNRPSNQYGFDAYELMRRHGFGVDD